MSGAGGRSLGGWFLEEAARAASRAAGAALAGERRQEAVARAVGLAQRGLERLGAAQEQALHAVGLAARPDYEEVTRQLARLKRKVRALDRARGAPGAAAAGAEAGPGEPGGENR